MKDFTTGCIEQCLQNEPPFCTAACPFGLDVKDFIAKVQRGGFQAAYKAYMNTVGFPGIVAALCPEPCKAVCPRGACGGAISMRLMERAAVAHARNLEPASYNVPPKRKTVAVVGAGPSGLACALRMATRGYEVTLFEKTGRIGGHLHGLLPPEAFLPEIERQFMHETYALKLDTEIPSLEGLAFDTVYVATGADGPDFGLVPDPGGAFASTRPCCFLGGSLTGRDTMGALADGLRASHALERYLKVGSMNHPAETLATKLKLDPAGIPAVPAVAPADGRGFTQEEAVAEAKRCLLCACDACYRACDLMHYFRKYPKRIAEEIQLSVYPGTLDGNGTLATRLMSTCNQCGLCKEVCPEGIDTGDLFLQGHRAMQAKGAMPWAWHHAFLQDMEAACGEAALSRLPAGTHRARYLFFPGCQLGASDPRYVTESYRFLRAHWPDTALALGCCGAPAEWAGDGTRRSEIMDRLRRDWEAFGRPTFVFACPTCRLMFGRHLPEIPATFLYELFLERGTVPAQPGRGKASVFDPCASRGEAGLQQTIRTLAERAGFELEPLAMEGRLAECCSYGGQVAIAHPPYADHMVQDRIAGSGHPCIAYCSNCRDIFAKAGKPAWHILDLLQGLNGPERRPATFSARRDQRLALKRAMLEAFWNETSEPEPAPMELILSPELSRKLSDAYLLESDFAAVVEHCERTGRKIEDPASGSFFGHLMIGPMTFWAEYRPVSGGFELVNAYAHRMAIEEA
jgi:Fe-S oxidoreductase